MNSTKLVYIYYNDEFRRSESKSELIKKIFDSNDLTGGNKILNACILEDFSLVILKFEDVDIYDRFMAMKKHKHENYEFEICSSMKNVSCTSSHSPQTVFTTDLNEQAEQTTRRPILIDGENVGMNHLDLVYSFSYKAIEIVIQFFNRLGFNDIRCIVQHSRRFSYKEGNVNGDPSILDRLLEADQLIYSKMKGFEKEILITMGIKRNAIIVSNENFSETYKNCEELTNYLKGENLINFKFYGDVFYPIDFLIDKYTNQYSSMMSFVEEQSILNQSLVFSSCSNSLLSLNSNKPEPQSYIVLSSLDSNCSESKLKLYLEVLLGTDSELSLKLIGSLNNRMAIYLRTIANTEIDEVVESQKRTLNDFPSLKSLKFSFIPKTKELLIKTSKEMDLDELKLFMSKMSKNKKFSIEDMDQSANIYLMTVKDHEDIDFWLKRSNNFELMLPNWDEIVKVLKTSSESSARPLILPTNETAIVSPPEVLTEAGIEKDEKKGSISIKHSYLYNLLKERKQNIENLFNLKLDFSGELSDAKSTDDFETESNASGSWLQNRRKIKLYEIKIISNSTGSLMACSKYLKTLNDNFRLYYFNLSDPKYKHAKNLFERKIKQYKLGSAQIDKELKDDKLMIKLVENEHDKKINLLATSPNPNVKNKMYKILQGFEVVKKELKLSDLVINELKRKKEEIAKSFNLKLVFYSEKSVIEVFHLASDLKEYSRFLNEYINKLIKIQPRTENVYPKSENLIAFKYFQSDYLRQVGDFLMANPNVEIEGDQVERFCSVKAPDQKILNETVKMLNQIFDKIKDNMKYLPKRLEMNVFNFLKKNGQILSRIESNRTISIKKPKEIIQPSLEVENKSKKLKLFICNGNIVDASTYCIVNSINENMANFGGVAKAISNAAGRDYNLECDSLKKPLDISKLFLINPGKLCCQSIMNVICPVYSPGFSMDKLSVKYKQCLALANKKEYYSIAIPLLGAGIFGWPIEYSMQALLNAIDQSEESKFLKEIYFIEQDKLVFNRILNYIKYSNINLKYSIVNFYNSDSESTIDSTTYSTNSKWYWIDNEFQWKEYRCDILKHINECLNSNKMIFKLKIDDCEYEFDLASKIQVNLQTGFVRKIENELKSVACAQWYWLEDNGFEQAYNLQQNEIIEKKYADDQATPLTLEIKRHIDDIDCNYTIDFTKMVQRNEKTNFERSILRKMIDRKPIVVKDFKNLFDSNNNSLDVNQTSKSESSVFFWFIGKSPNVENALKDFEKQVLDVVHVGKIENQNLSNLSKKELTSKNFKFISKNELSKDGVKITQKENDIMLECLLHSDLMQVKQDLYEMLLSCRAKEIEFPIYWSIMNVDSIQTPHENGKHHKLFEIKKNSIEWVMIETEFNRTMPSNSIIKIERIENEKIYKYYHDEKNYLVGKHPTNALNETFLWHGTRTTDPWPIFSSDKFGLDYHFANDGMWGRGIYFSKNASYSSAYAFTKPDGTKQFFYCSVLLGESVKLEPDRSLKLPPLKSEPDVLSRYDSVEGFTQNTQIFVVYENQKVYPSYLVSYK